MTNERILARDLTVSCDSRTTGLNNNDIIIGPSGSGKTRGYVIPNILQANESLVVSDVKGNLRRQLGPVLEAEGYQVIDLDFTDCAASPWGYNPLTNIRQSDDRPNEQDILTAAACMVPVTDQKDPFWDFAARMLLEGLIGYVLLCLPDEEHTPAMVARLMREMGEKHFHTLYQELEQIQPECFAVDRYKMYRLMGGADRMTGSIQGILAVALSPYLFDGARALFSNPNRLCFEDIARRRTAVFLTVSDTDRSLDSLVTLFFAQALQALIRLADKSPDARLAVPVRFILDDFAANVRIPDFDQTTSIIRSREISVSLIIQSLSQLETLYGSSQAKTILNNCDHCLYLGGQDVETAAYVAKKADRPTSDILNMPLEDGWLFTRGQPPRTVEKYLPETHPRYPKPTKTVARKEGV